MGYRKALEFLVKDWAKKNIAEDDIDKEKKIDSIQKGTLSTVINNFYSGDLQSILKRATWLGNDEAHYIKLFDDMPVEVLKRLISLIMAELDRDFQKEYFIKTITLKI